MRAVLLGGAPGAGKSRVAEALLAAVADRSVLVQWVDVDVLRRHQPWRVDDTTTTTTRANLTAVTAAALAARVDVLVITWVFQSTELHDVAASWLPEGVDVVTAQLVADEATWRRRFADDPRRPRLTPFFEGHSAQAQAVPATHVLDTSASDAAAVAGQLVEVLGLDARC